MHRMPGTFSPPPRISDPDMHHGTCATHMPWCIPGSLTHGFLWSWCRGKRSRHSRCMHKAQFYVSGKGPMQSACMGYESDECTRLTNMRCRIYAALDPNELITPWCPGYFSFFPLFFLCISGVSSPTVNNGCWPNLATMCQSRTRKIWIGYNSIYLETMTPCFPRTMHCIAAMETKTIEHFYISTTQP